MITIEQFRSLENHNFELKQIDDEYIIARYREFQIHISGDEKENVICFQCVDFNEEILMKIIDNNTDEIENAISNCIEIFNL